MIAGFSPIGVQSDINSFFDMFTIGYLIIIILYILLFNQINVSLGKGAECCIVCPLEGFTPFGY